ncbi:hypothetical protein [Methylocystis sp. JR02]|uniref:hypothetical protein n=1 Tax=Methylocystis sp. JR02 TaxID=3046284 RepID=UPI0024B8BD19|nr:hypothetical protein [Methylocystis sp. JR02]MDJ0447121.1 hypothetical protein [Methylocystis sp. JR02]
MSAIACGDHGSPEGHRLGGRQIEAFAARRQNHGPAGSIEGDQLRLVHELFIDDDLRRIRV